MRARKFVLWFTETAIVELISMIRYAVTRDNMEIGLITDF
jgi:hypothetical protein